MNKYAIGIDFGTLSVRVLLVNVGNGREEAMSVCEYAHGVMESHLPCGKVLPADFALQDPADYLEGMIMGIRQVLAEKKVLPEEVIGIGVDFTSSTVLPVKKDKIPLCCLPEFSGEPHAYVKLWKHHGAKKEAQQMDEIAKKRGEDWLSFYGGKVSSEWMIPKILETLHEAPRVYQEADRFLEALDWIIWYLTDTEICSTCGAGYKAFHRHDSGYPSVDFFRELDPRLEHVVEEKLNAPLKTVGECAGGLCIRMANVLGLRPGTPVAAGIIDAHASVPGCQISEPGTMMLIIGTSSCHLMLSETEAGITGVGGLVKDGILPGYFGYEAGQCCVGDLFGWFVKNGVPERYHQEAREKDLSLHQLLTEKIKDYRAGQSGLLALDWFNGVRSPLMDFDLNGMILGMNLRTKPEEIYLALIEATAYGTRMIIEQFEAAGVPVKSIVLGGGIPVRNQKLVQVYADVCRREIRLAGTAYASALGAAILGTAAAPTEVTGFENIKEIVQKLGKVSTEVFIPDQTNADVYDQLYEEYKTLHCYLGTGENNVMKRLNALRQRI